MPATDFFGYGPKGGVLFGWDLEEVALKRAKTGSERGFADVAIGVRAKADGEREGLKVVEGVGAVPAYTRRFFFACTYSKDGAADLSFKNLVRAGDSIVDGDGSWWLVEAVANPGGADEHLEVNATRGPAA